MKSLARGFRSNLQGIYDNGLDILESAIAMNSQIQGKRQTATQHNRRPFSVGGFSPITKLLLVDCCFRYWEKSIVVILSVWMKLFCLWLDKLVLIDLIFFLTKLQAVKWSWHLLAQKHTQHFIHPILLSTLNLLFGPIAQ